MRSVHFHDCIRPTLGMLGQNRFHCLHRGHDLAVSGKVIVLQPTCGFEPVLSLISRSAELDGRHFAKELLNHFDAVTALRSLAPRLQKLAVVVVIDRDFSLAWRAPFDGALDSALSAVAVPHSVVKAE